jgi:hypothetical protein
VLTAAVVGREWHLADMPASFNDVRYWGTADIAIQTNA